MRLARRIFPIACIFVFVVAMVFWIRSNYVHDWVKVEFADDHGTKISDEDGWTRYDSWAIGTGPGHITFDRTISDEPRGGGGGTRFLVRSHPVIHSTWMDPPDNRVLGFHWRYSPWPVERFSDWGAWFSVPFYVFLPLAIPPLQWLRRWQRRRARGFPVSMRPTPSPL